MDCDEKVVAEPHHFPWTVSLLIGYLETTIFQFLSPWLVSALFVLFQWMFKQLKLIDSRKPVLFLQLSSSIKTFVFSHMKSHPITDKYSWQWSTEESMWRSYSSLDGVPIPICKIPDDFTSGNYFTSHVSSMTLE